MLTDVFDGSIHTVDDPRGNDRSQELSSPVLVNRRNHAGVRSANDLVPSHLASCFDQIPDNERNQFAGSGAIEENALCSAANAGAPHLRVQRNPARPRPVGSGIHINVANAFKVGEHRTRASRCTRSTRLQPPRGTRTSTAPSQPARSSRTASRSGVRTIWTAASGRPADNNPLTKHSCIAAELRILSEPPRRIAALPAFQAETASVRSNIWAALEDHRNNTERRPNPADAKAVRTRPCGGNRPYRVLQGSDVPH